MKILILRAVDPLMYTEIGSYSLFLQFIFLWRVSARYGLTPILLARRGRSQGTLGSGRGIR
jgi:hypothetical protein